MLPNAYTPLADASIEQKANVRQVLSDFPNICLFEKAFVKKQESAEDTSKKGAV